MNNSINDKFWAGVAREFLVAPGTVFLNTGTHGPSPRPVHVAHVNALMRINSDFPNVAYGPRLGNPGGEEEYLALRRDLGEFVGAEPSELALTHGASEAVALAFEGCDLRPGDELLYTSHDHFCAVNPLLWKAHRNRLIPRCIDVSDPSLRQLTSSAAILSRLEQAISRKTRLLLVSHVASTDGFVMPIKAIADMARQKGVLTLVDGAQAPGMIPVNLRDLECDFYAGSLHKWLCAGGNSGFLYASRRIHHILRPTLYMGTVDRALQNCQPIGTTAPVVGSELFSGVGLLELRGAVNYPEEAAIAASLRFFKSVGLSRIYEQIRELRYYSLQRLSELKEVKVLTESDGTGGSGLVAFCIRTIPPAAVTALLRQKNIYIRDTSIPQIHWHANRVSLHILNERHHIDKLVNALSQLVKE